MTCEALKDNAQTPSVCINSLGLNESTRDNPLGTDTFLEQETGVRDRHFSSLGNCLSLSAGPYPPVPAWRLQWRSPTNLELILLSVLLSSTTCGATKQLAGFVVDVDDKANESAFKTDNRVRSSIVVAAD